MFSWLKKKKGSKNAESKQVTPNSEAGSRRAFLRGDFIPKAPAERSKATTSIALLRPPGAIAEAEFLTACTKCGDCGRACPHEAIVFAQDRFREAARTPMIDAFSSPCMMCVDTPCIKACPTDALQEVVGFAMGKALLQTFNCLAYNRSFCSTCEERCPVPGAITLTDAKPVINAEICTGCGVCHHVCPAPMNAIMILPNKNRPLPEPLVGEQLEDGESGE